MTTGKPIFVLIQVFSYLQQIGLVARADEYTFINFLILYFISEGYIAIEIVMKLNIRSRVLIKPSNNMKILKVIHFQLQSN